MRFLKHILLAAMVSILGIGAMTLTASAKDADGNIVLVIDAGHGETDPGMLAVTGAEEADINLLYATAMRDELMQYDGIRVYLTRSDDSWLTNTGRAMVAKAMNADFLISLHNNSGGETSTGALAFRTINPLYEEQTNDMCALILSELENLGFYNGGVQTRPDDKTGEDYYTLISEGVRAGIPSIIVEHLFLSNPTDAAYVSNEDGSLITENCKKIGQADAKAVVAYFNLVKKTAKADSSSVLTLPKGYSVQVTTPELTSDSVSWYSIDSSVATVDENGLAKAVNSGTTNIVYKTSGGEQGYLTLTVLKTEALALVGAINPTFYDDSENYLSNIDLSTAFAFVIFNDGTSQKVTPTVTGSVDYDQVGIQQIAISYNDLSGTIQICHNTSDYIPEVTEAPSEEETETETQTQTEEVIETETESETEAAIHVDVWISTKYIIIFCSVLLVLVILAIIIAVAESKKKRHRRNRRYYR